MTRNQRGRAEWLEISVVVPTEFAEPVTHLFSKHGDGRVFVEQRGDWDIDDPDSSIEEEDVTVYGYLLKDDSITDRKAMIDVGIALIGALTPILAVAERDVDESEWEHQTFPSIRVGKRVLIAPMDEAIDPTPDDFEGPNGEARIYLAPGLAFGTGNHPTTRLCIEQIEEEFADGENGIQTVADVGCGSGVLAIAALKFGAMRAWCLDIDDTAIRAVARNLRMSEVSDRAAVVQGSLPYDGLPEEGCDLVLANITSRVIVDMVDDLIAATKVQGVIIVSGVLTEKCNEVLAAFDCDDVELTNSRQQGDWSMFRFSKVG